jgi:hypothetical protein
VLSSLTLTGPIYSSVRPHNRRIHISYIHRLRGQTYEYMGRASGRRVRLTYIGTHPMNIGIHSHQFNFPLRLPIVPPTLPKRFVLALDHHRHRSPCCVAAAVTTTSDRILVDFESSLLASSPTPVPRSA